MSQKITQTSAPAHAAEPASAPDAQPPSLEVLELNIGDLAAAQPQRGRAPVGEPASEHPPQASTSPPQDLVLSASRRIVLQCGLSSITLHANGKVELRGESIVNAANGINRIAGAQIELN